MLLSLADININFKNFSALRNISFDLSYNEIMGIVGESGSGKTTLARFIAGLETAQSGRFDFCGTRQPLQANKRDFQQQAMHLQMVFQNPYASLNPRLSVYESVAEGLVLQGQSEIPARVRRQFEAVGLDSAMIHRYPHEFSGGQRQRIAIARALVMQPDLLICDEAISALDVSIQAQIVSLLYRLQQDQGFSILFIAHDLAMVRALTQRVIIMQAGEIVEQGETSAVFSAPQHSYSKKLLAAQPSLP